MTAIQAFPDITVEAGEDFTGMQFHCVKIDAGDVDLCDTQGERVYGVLQDEGLAGESVTVRILGPTKLKAGGIIELGDPLQVEANARAIVGVGGDYIFARADEPGVDGDVIAATITHEGIL